MLLAAAAATSQLPARGTPFCPRDALPSCGDREGPPECGGLMPTGEKPGDAAGHETAAWDAVGTSGEAPATEAADETRCMFCLGLHAGTSASPLAGGRRGDACAPPRA
eukprot:scaffold78463_cov28-Tisochrysis_lutea.AAC.3